MFHNLLSVHKQYHYAEFYWYHITTQLILKSGQRSVYSYLNLNYFPVLNIIKCCYCTVRFTGLQFRT
jgi:hypothetical protein